QRAILAGDKKTGITIMQMDAGLDTGDILATFPVKIETTDTAEDLHDRLSLVGARAITEVLAKLDSFQKTPIPQQQELATYAKKLSRNESAINWAESCVQLERKIRAFNPWPGSQTAYEDTVLRIWQAESNNESHQSEPGSILSADKSGIRIACGEGSLLITELQRAGGKILPAADFLNGIPLQTGKKLGDNANA
ncbi:MAG: methionyl-tRNA formyltransferase, partial [Gammaproteobacteria bacterium]|nr:methionyl-tRNA formyltransferase [Gammaproteobacteria bacterium]